MTDNQRTQSRVLFCDTNSRYADWSDVMKRAGANWIVDRVDSLQSGLALASTHRYDAVLVSAITSPERELAFLRQIMTQFPKTVRILYTPMLSPTSLSKALDVTHSLCLDSTSAQDLIDLVERAIAASRQLSEPKLLRSFAAFKQLPSPPSVFHELTRQLNSERTTAQHIAAVVSKDPALAARLLRIVNSSYFGLSQSISNIQQAVTLLGTRTIRGLALAGHFGSHYKSDSRSTLFSLDALQSRSLMVARLAQSLARIAGGDALLRDQAFLSGLLLDVGMVMLASEQTDAYTKIFGYTAKHNRSLSDVELKAFGVTHADLGACLLTKWNLPPRVIEAVQHHHNPAAYTQSGLTPLAVAHVADALLPSLNTQPSIQANATLDTEFLAQAGLVEFLPKWRMEANGFRLQAKQAV